MLRLKMALLVGACSLIPATAAADVPEPVRAMIDAAIAKGDAETVKAVFELAKQTNPDDVAEIAALEADYQQAELAKAAEAAREEEAAMRNAGLFDNWKGQGQLGAFRSSGNTSDTGLTAGLSLERVGIKWRHKLTGLADYQRSNGATTREQFLASYEANYDVSDRLFLYGLAQYERDRFQGFSSRYSASGGLGYRVIEADDMTLSIKAGPAYRRTQFIGGGSDSALAGLASADFDWQVSDNVKLTQDASAFVQSNNSTFISTTGLAAGLGSGLSAQISYTVEHDTDPPVGAVKTDTLSRVTLIYDF